MPSRWRVPAAYLAGLVLLALARPTPRAILLGLPLVVLGEAVRLWASGHIEKTARLATGGPYAHTRNPLYVGSLLLGAGLAVACGGRADGSSAAVALLVVVYFAAFYPSVMREEARFLASRFPEAYAEWARAVPLFWPRLLPAGPRESRFSWPRVRANREWRTAAGVPLAILLLWLRSRITVTYP